MRSLIGGIVHESSTLMLELMGPTGLAGFARHGGDELVREFTSTNTVLGGYLGCCRRYEVTPVPTWHARAEPGPTVAAAAYARLERDLLEALTAAGPCELALLDLHGAGAIAPDNRSLDLTLLRGVREAVGPDCTVAATMDLHANIPPELLEHLDVLVGFAEYPHTDMAERAGLAAEIAVDRASGRCLPVVRQLRLPMLLPPSPTTSGASAEARDLARTMEARDGVLACTVFHGFPYADTEAAATSVVTVADGDAALAERCNLELAAWLWENRERFLIETLPPEEAVQAALRAAGRPVVIGDATDNPGTGAAGDSTYLLRELIACGAHACLATLHDPAAVAAAVAAGAGRLVDLRLGGGHGWASGQPVRAIARVRAITDGKIVQQSMRRGKVADFGTSVRLDLGATEVIASTNRIQILDPEILRLHGIMPERFDILAVKSLNHFRAGFADIAEHLLVADAPGPLSRDIAGIPRGGPTARLWPMSQKAEFAPGAMHGAGR